MIADLATFALLALIVWQLAGRPPLRRPAKPDPSRIEAVRALAPYKILSFFILLALISTAAYFRLFEREVAYRSLLGEVSAVKMTECFGTQREIVSGFEPSQLPMIVVDRRCPSGGVFSVARPGQIRCSLHGIATRQ